MPAFSRTETLLIPRYNNDSLDPQSKTVFPSCFGKQDAFLVALPCFSVEISIQHRKNHDDNVFFKTVSRLYKIKESEGLEENQIYDYITRKTALDRLVVKKILEQENNHADRITKEENYEEERNRCVLIYEPIGGIFLYPCIAREDYEHYGQVEEDSVAPNTKQHVVSFTMQIADHAETALMLGIDNRGTGWDQFHDLVHPDHVPLGTLKEIKKEIEKGNRGSCITAEDAGNWQPVWLVCSCGVDPRDLTAVSVRSVASNKYGKQLLTIIRDTTRSNPDANQELLRKLEKLEERRQFHLEHAVTFAEEKRDAQIGLLSRYPDLRQYGDVSDKVSAFIARFPSDASAEKSGDTLQNHVWDEWGRREAMRDFHTAMEAVFTASVNIHYPVRKQNAIMMAIAPLRSSQESFAGYFAGMAKEIGFTEVEQCRQTFEKTAIRVRDIPKILEQTGEAGSSKDDKKQWGLMELVIASMMEAYVDPSHPFRKIASRCPNLFEVVKESKKKRDKETHNDQQKDPLDTVEELYRKRALLESCLELLSARVDRQQEAVLRKKWGGQIAAASKAKEMVKNYAALGKLVETKEAAWEVCYRLHYKDAQFFSKCYNLMDALLLELLHKYDCPHGKTVLAQFLTGKTDAENWLCVQRLFGKYGCEYLKDVPASRTCDLLGKGRETSKWPMRSKLAVIFVTFDHDQPEILKEMLHLFPDLVLIADKIHKARGHNNSTDFSASKDGYQGFTMHLLSSCEAVAKMILEGKKDGKEPQ